MTLASILRRSAIALAMCVPVHAGADDATAKPPPSFTIGRKGFGFESSDGTSSLYTHWFVATDFQAFFGRLPPGVTVRDAFVASAAGLQLDAVLHRYVHSRLTVDFSRGRANLFDAWVQVEAVPWLNVKVGRFPYPISEERLTPPLNLPFVSTSAASLLLPSADVGIQASGTIGRGLLRYNVAVTNGGVAGVPSDSDVDSSKDVVVRAFARPFQRVNVASVRELGLGLGASTGIHHGRLAAPLLPILRTYGGQTFFSYRNDGTEPGTSVASGRVTRIVPHATWAWGPIALYADAVFAQERVGTTTLTSRAWSVIPTVVLTGEHAAPLAFITPRHELDPSAGHLGTILLTGGAGSIAMDRDAFAQVADPTVAMRRATVIGGGANWYPFAGIALLIDYGYMWFAPAAGGTTRTSEQTFIARFEMAL